MEIKIHVYRVPPLGIGEGCAESVALQPHRTTVLQETVWLCGVFIEPAQAVARSSQGCIKFARGCCAHNFANHGDTNAAAGLSPLLENAQRIFDHRLRCDLCIPRQDFEFLDSIPNALLLRLLFISPGLRSRSGASNILTVECDFSNGCDGTEISWLWPFDRCGSLGDLPTIPGSPTVVAVLFVVTVRWRLIVIARKIVSRHTLLVPEAHFRQQ